MTLLADESNESRIATGKQRSGVIKIRAIPVDLVNYQKSTIKVSKLFCCKKTRLSRKFRHGEIDNSMPLLQCCGTKKVQNRKTLKEFKVLMLRYELKERAKTEDQLRIYNFDEANKEELTALAT